MVRRRWTRRACRYRADAGVLVAGQHIAQPAGRHAGEEAGLQLGQPRLRHSRQIRREEHRIAGEHQIGLHFVVHQFFLAGVVLLLGQEAADRSPLGAGQCRQPEVVHVLGVGRDC